MKNNIERLEYAIFVILITFIIVFTIIVIYVLIDFKNDYKCSTTSDSNWYIEHNCMRYERKNNNE